MLRRREPPSIAIRHGNCLQIQPLSWSFERASGWHV